MRVTDPDDRSRTREGFLLGARAICSLAGLCWVAALIALALVYAMVSYSLCSGTILQFPPPTVHWPPEGHNLQFVDLLHSLTAVAMGMTIIGVFLVLYASPERGAYDRTRWFLATVAGTLVMGALFWLAGEYHSLRAHLDALGNCL
ncbi:MAG: hypothetical protein PVSMB7_27360 [Chloroflexota bacterium]